MLTSYKTVRQHHYQEVDISTSDHRASYNHKDPAWYPDVATPTSSIQPLATTFLLYISQFCHLKTVIEMESYKKSSLETDFFTFGFECAASVDQCSELGLV